MSKLLLVISMALFLIACQSNSGSQEDRQPNSTNPKKIGENDAESSLFSSILKKPKAKSIVLPPDLVGSASQKVKKNHDDAATERGQEVLPDVIGATVVNDNGRRWLQVESAPQPVWKALTDFWAAERIELVEFEPSAGLMETDWIATGTESGNSTKKRRIFRTLFSRIIGAGTSFDKYKIRLEKQGDKLTNIYVTHRSTEKIESNFNSPQKITEWEWVEGDSDAEKVAQLLQIMVLIFDSNSRNSV